MVAILKLIFGLKIGPICEMVPLLKTKYQSSGHFRSKYVNVVANTRLYSSSKNETTKHDFVVNNDMKSIKVPNEWIES
jgi:hypothetical protein